MYHANPYKMTEHALDRLRGIAQMPQDRFHRAIQPHDVLSLIKEIDRLNRDGVDGMVKIMQQTAIACA